MTTLNERGNDEKEMKFIWKLYWNKKRGQNTGDDDVS